MTSKIRSLTAHTVAHPQDLTSRRGLDALVEKRKKMMRYLKKHDAPTYWNVLQYYNLRDMV